MKPCFGIMCVRHTQCVHYHAVNGAIPDEPRQGTCDDGKGYLSFKLVEKKA
jgi:hypothetical protein